MNCSTCYHDMKKLQGFSSWSWHCDNCEVDGPVKNTRSPHEIVLLYEEYRASFNSEPKLGKLYFFKGLFYSVDELDEKREYAYLRPTLDESAQAPEATACSGDSCQPPHRQWTQGPDVPSSDRALSQPSVAPQPARSLGIPLPRIPLAQGTVPPAGSSTPSRGFAAVAQALKDWPSTKPKPK